MQKLFFLILLIIIFLSGYFYLNHIYPVAMVNGNFIWYQEWQRAFQGEENFLNNEVLHLANKTTINFNLPQNSDIKNKTARETLLLLIQREILLDGGKKLDDNFTSDAANKANKAIAQSDVTASYVKNIYGFSLNDFFNLLVLPAAYREVVALYLAPRHIDFTQWFTEQSKSASVHLFFVPYRWDGVTLN